MNLTTNLIVAATGSDGPLSQGQIDDVLEIAVPRSRPGE